MTEIIAHRRNTVAQLAATPATLGVEVDIRSCGNALIIHHDPFAAGERFEDWIAVYAHGTLILNVKEEGLEQQLIAAMAEHGIDRYFFLDQSFPFLLRTAALGERRCAVRVSEYESLQTALSLSGQIDWVWVDCFTRFPLNSEDATRLQGAGFKLCIVSPELQGRGADGDVAALRDHLAAAGIVPEAVCTNRPELWA